MANSIPLHTVADLRRALAKAKLVFVWVRISTVSARQVQITKKEARFLVDNMGDIPLSDGFAVFQQGYLYIG